MADVKNKFFTYTIEHVVPKNMGIEAGILFLSPVDSEILHGLGPWWQPFLNSKWRSPGGVIFWGLVRK